MLLNRALDDDSDTEWENPETIDSRATPRPESTTAEMVDEYPEISGITNAREAMKKMPEEDKAVIAEQVESFRTEKRMFDQEVSKWDDQGNDIIVLAKHMCMPTCRKPTNPSCPLFGRWRLYNRPFGNRCTRH